MTTDDPKGLKPWPLLNRPPLVCVSCHLNNAMAGYCECKHCYKVPEEALELHTRLKNLEILSLSDQLSAAMQQLGERAARITELERDLRVWKTSALNGDVHIKKLELELRETERRRREDK